MADQNGRNNTQLVYRFNLYISETTRNGTIWKYSKNTSYRSHQILTKLWKTNSNAKRGRPRSKWQERLTSKSTSSAKLSDGHFHIRWITCKIQILNFEGKIHFYRKMKISIFRVPRRSRFTIIRTAHRFRGNNRVPRLTVWLRSSIDHTVTLAQNRE